MPFSFPSQLPSLFFEPKRYRPHGIGYWSGHIPFACDLIHTLRPQVFVELGTHMGESYFAFCQAVAESRIVCRTYAIDTWRGDQHTGSYGDQVFNEVNACNREYSHFSRLLRKTFQEAAPQFNAGSIDLLHIDGAHTYEAVLHDFDSWWPKVKPGGVVLMHDSFERGHGFGVWQVFVELQAQYPAAEFTHSHGLAVVCKPPARQAHVAAAFTSDDEVLRASIRRYYEMCAASLRQHHFERHREPADWEITAQLFWRSKGEGFSEQRSVRAAEVVRGEPQMVCLPIPPRTQPPEELRLAASLTPALLALHQVRLLNCHGQVVWQQNAPEGLPEWRMGGLRAKLDDTRAMLFDVPAKAAFTLPVSPATLSGIEQGGEVQVELGGLNPFEFSVALGAD